MFEPRCLRSGRCSRVEKGGGLKCPSRLPLQTFSMIHPAFCIAGTDILTWIGKSTSVDLANEYSSMCCKFQLCSFLSEADSPWTGASTKSYAFDFVLSRDASKISLASFAE